MPPSLDPPINPVLLNQPTMNNRPQVPPSISDYTIAGTQVNDTISPNINDASSINRMSDHDILDQHIAPLQPSRVNANVMTPPIAVDVPSVQKKMGKTTAGNKLKHKELENQPIGEAITDDAQRKCHTIQPPKRFGDSPMKESDIRSKRKKKKTM
ncbi:hypothetical protein CPB84DRAFT_1851248 [Gymnopilus junonius]|uniref:Uncharacterized protein n=1 Tax=Gymnopilus junonius TaxID=109634 RepID=A0A9P5NFV7_GYMJU|nr:hypothetical protein CPB84DRAFT_1851248 [Gymnopilus junonius]